VAQGDPIDAAADELYGLPPREFTHARDARAKEVRGEGNREAADAIKELRKPTVAAWALNQLARRRPKDVERLVKAGKALRAAQEELVAGGDRAAFQEAANGERELVADLSAAATAITSEAGERGAGLQEKVAGTLHAAALDDGIARELRAGRLVREREAIGGFGGPTTAAPARGGAGSRSSAASGRGAKAARSLTRDRDAAKRAEQRQRESAEQRQRVSAAMTDERHARRELEAARRALKNAQQRADAAAAHAAEAAERARATAERLKEAKRSATTAQTAHRRATGALESAERDSSRRS